MSWSGLGAFAQYTRRDADAAWKAYNAAFLAADLKGGQFFASGRAEAERHPGNPWIQAEEIELADDAYEWAVRNDPHADSSRYIGEINRLCLGFTNAKGHLWGANNWNDDILWGVLAFVRAYKLTHNPSQLADAKANFDLVWQRAQAPHGKGNGLSGLMQIQPFKPTWKPNLDSPTNWAVVIAGYLLYAETHIPIYKTAADNVYGWAMDSLYDETRRGGPCNGHPERICAKILDSNSSLEGLKIGPSDYSYNYGVAITASVLHGDKVVAQRIANYLMYNMRNPNFPYAGTTTLRGKTYTLLPNYGQGKTTNAGYNGIALRGVGFGRRAGALDATTLAWAQANVAAAWSNRNAQTILWNDWTPGHRTPAPGNEYSWDASPAVAGLLDIPPPGVALKQKGVLAGRQPRTPKP